MNRRIDDGLTAVQRYRKKLREQRTTPIIIGRPPLKDEFSNLSTPDERWRKRNPDKVKTHNAKRKQLRLDIINLLGNKCSNCGYIGLAIQIDHVNGGGNKERKTSKGKVGVSYGYYKRIKDKILKGSKEYQLLCANCNFIKRMTVENGEIT
jgi:hypothetical protein